MARSELPGDAKAAVTLAAVLIALALAIDVGAVAWVLGPIAFLAIVYAMVKAPLRHSLMGMMFCALILENPTDGPAAGMWKSPLYPFGALMLSHMNQSTGVSWMFLSGSEYLIVILTAIALLRRSNKSKIDRKGRILSPKPLSKLAFISLAGTAYVELWGVVRGGDFSKSLWQVDKVIYVPIVFLLFDAALRNHKDFVAVGRVLILAACWKAATAVWVMNFVDFGAATEPPAFATSHHDSLLFANAVVLLLSLVIHRGARASAGRVGLLLAPLLVWGMISNNRRMVWVQIGLVFLTVYFAMPMNAVKRKIKKAVKIASPFAAVYVAIGWKFSGGIFKPVDTIKSVLQPATDVSTMTRDIENYDIAVTIRQNPIFGSGYGHPYLQIIPLPPMPHPLEQFLPHNSLLGLWFCSGFIGYTMMTLLWAAGVYFGVRAYRMATRPFDRAASLVTFGAVLAYMIQCYGDVGLGSWTAVYTVAPALAIGGKLAMLTGAWPSRAQAAEALDVESPAPDTEEPEEARAAQ